MTPASQKWRRLKRRPRTEAESAAFAASVERVRKILRRDILAERFKRLSDPAVSRLFNPSVPIEEQEQLLLRVEKLVLLPEKKERVKTLSALGALHAQAYAMRLQEGSWKPVWKDPRFERFSEPASKTALRQACGKWCRRTKGATLKELDKQRQEKQRGGTRDTVRLENETYPCQTGTLPLRRRFVPVKQGHCRFFSLSI